jgi:hypothetical protein
MTDRPRTLRIQPKNPADFREGEVEGLKTDLSKALPRTYAVVVTEPPPQVGRGVTWYEVIQMWVVVEPYAKALAQHVVTKILDKTTAAFVAWVRARRKKKGSSRRPTYAVIFGPDGEVLKAILVDQKGKVIDRTAEEIETRQRYKLPAQQGEPPDAPRRVERGSSEMRWRNGGPTTYLLWGRYVDLAASSAPALQLMRSSREPSPVEKSARCFGSPRFQTIAPLVIG